MFYEHLIRPLLFSVDPERIHEKILHVLASKPWLLLPVGRFARVHRKELEQKLWGLTFGNPIGLAAGFDKFGIALPAWGRLGFGFAEIGTVTAQAQPGNDRPRLFRLPDDAALINRFGFNNNGAELTAMKIAAHRGTIPVGVNIGKTKLVDLDRAVEDYRQSFEQLWPQADYIVVNVSSPNTPGLRQLQDRSFLVEILRTLQTVNRDRSTRAGLPIRPLLVKIAPDLEWPQIDDVLSVAEETGAAGVVATNTTIRRDGLRSSIALTAETGGLSGRPVRERSTEIIRYIRQRTGTRFTVIGVGGIFEPEDAYEKIRAGASLVQVYTGFVYGGPFLCRRLNYGLIRLMARDGFSNISDAVGTDI